MLLLKATIKTISVLSVLLIFSLFLLPGFEVGGLSFRAEDFLVVFITLGLMFLLIFTKTENYKVAPVFKWLIVYLVYCSVITIIRVFVSDLHPIYILFYAKEIQYFVYFIAFYYLARNSSKFVEYANKGLVSVSVITVLWCIFQLATGNIRGYYGIGIISVQNPSQSGVVLYLSSLYLLYMSLNAKKKKNAFMLTIISLLAAVMTVGTISRTAILVLIATFGIYMFLSLFRRKWNVKKVFIGAYLSVALVPVGFFLVGDLVSSITERFSRFDDGANTRWEHWRYFLSHGDGLGEIFGNGKGFMQVIVGSFTLQADNQYVRLLVEVGVVGLIMWMMIMLSLVIFCMKNMKFAYNDSLFLLLITLGFMMLGVTQEAYLVAIQGSLYFILTGLLLGKIMREKGEIVNEY